MADILFPTNTTGVTPASGDIILIADASDSNNPKDCTLAELPISTATQTALDAKQDTLTGLTASVTELNYTDGVTSSIQTQLDSKGTGDVSKVGTPSNNQVGVWTGDGTIEGASGLQFNGTTLGINTIDTMTVNGGAITAQYQAHSDTIAVYESHTHSDTAGNGGIFYSARSRGSEGSQTIVQSGDTLGAMAFVGYDGTDYATSAGIFAYADGTPGSNDMPGRLVFYTTPDGSQTLTEAMRISSNQNISMVGALIHTNNAITASGNSATIPITHKLHTVTNNSAATLTITLTTSGATDGQIHIVRILDFSAVSQTLTFVNTENSDVSVPTTSNGSTTLPRTVAFMFNSSTSKWRCLANV